MSNHSSRQSNEPVSVIPKERMTAYQRWEIPSFGKSTPSSNSMALLAGEAELKGIQQQAHTEGYASGQAAGYAAGIQKAQVEVAQINALMQSLHESLNQVDQQIAQSLLDLSLEVASKMVRETLQARPEIVLEIIQEAIGSLPHFNQNAHLVMNTQDADLVREHMGEQLTHAGWKIFTDSQIQRGGCKVATAHSHIDATNEERWRHIVESIGQEKSWKV